MVLEEQAGGLCRKAQRWPLPDNGAGGSNMVRAQCSCCRQSLPDGCLLSLPVTCYCAGILQSAPCMLCILACACSSSIRSTYSSVHAVVHRGVLYITASTQTMMLTRCDLLLRATLNGNILWLLPRPLAASSSFGKLCIPFRCLALRL